MGLVTLHIDMLVVDLPPADLNAVLQGSTAQVKATVAATVLDHLVSSRDGDTGIDQ